MKNLVIVESPAKAKTIAKYLGKDYVVKSSFGHIRDLPKKGLNIDIAKNFEPNYEVSVDKKKVVAELKKSAKEADTIWLASDEDREGEAIAWHLCEVLKLDNKTAKRIVFHEITKEAIQQAIANPRTVDINLVNAQQARRVLDRLVGYELSPVLWKKVRTGLSAGRVQSVAVRLIVEREREISNFQSSSKYKVIADFNYHNQNITAELNTRFEDEDLAKKFLSACPNSIFTIADIIDKPSQRNPAAPFTTSTLQQEASRKLGYSVKQTMTLAQRLYENGDITYMRTDSTNLSNLALSASEKYIKATFGDKYFNQRVFKTKNASAQEAHEAIRPTDINSLNAGANPAETKLYQLIWKRMVASQMAPAQTLKTELHVDISNRDEKFIAKGEVLQFDGFLKVYGGGKEDAILPQTKIGDKLTALKIEAFQTFSKPPARYSEASLVKTLEELGIGRPSTYAPIISTIQARGYIEKSDLEGEERTIIRLILKDGEITREESQERFGADRNKLIPTHLAEMVTDFLIKYFSKIIDPGFTATAEEDLDKIEEGKLIWQKSIKEFYEMFHPLISKTDKVSRQETSQARLLGKDPKTGAPIYARYGRYGPMLQKGEVEESDTKPTFAPMPTSSTLESVTLEQALEMFKLPRILGKSQEGEEIKANIGRFGPYIQVDKTFVSIKPLDPFTISLEEATKLYNDKKANDTKKEIKQFDKTKISVLQGPYGPYVTDGKKNARIPKDIKPDEISLDQAKELLTNAKPSRRRFKKRTQ